MERTLASDAATQGVDILAHYQNGFNWESVAASGVGAYVGAESAGWTKSLGGFGSRFANGLASGVAAGETTAVLGGSKFDAQQVATDAFGNALGQGLADDMTPTANTPGSGDGIIKNGIKLSRDDWASILGGSLNTNYDSSFQNPFSWDTNLPSVSTAQFTLDPTLSAGGAPQAPTPYTAQSGDSISGILGTSNPAAITAFMQLNRMGGANSTIYAGRDYLIPTADQIAGADPSQGQAALDRDNTRLVVNGYLSQMPQMPSMIVKDQTGAQLAWAHAMADWRSNAPDGVLGAIHGQLDSRFETVDSVLANDAQNTQMVVNTRDAMAELSQIPSGHDYLNDVLDPGQWGRAIMRLQIGDNRMDEWDHYWSDRQVDVAKPAIIDLDGGTITPQYTTRAAAFNDFSNAAVGAVLALGGSRGGPETLEWSGIDTPEIKELTENPTDQAALLRRFSYISTKLPTDIYSDDQGVFGYRPIEESTFSAKKWPLLDWTDPNQVSQGQAFRLHYMLSEQNFVQNYLDQGVGGEDLARSLVDFRNEARLSYYTDDQLPVVYNRNATAFNGNIIGPSYDDLFLKYGTVQGVIDAGQRGNLTPDILLGIATPLKSH